MKTRSTPAETKHEKRKIPPRKGFHFWAIVIIPSFFWDLISSIIFVNFFQAFGPICVWIGLIINVSCAFLYAKHYKNKLMLMSDEDYEKEFKPMCSCQNKKLQWDEPDFNPMDPACTSYWTIGPGSKDDR